MTNAHTPPQDKAVERLVLATLLNNPKLIPDHWTLLGSGSVFYHEPHQNLARLIYDVFSLDRPVRLLNILRLAQERQIDQRLPEKLSEMQTEGSVSDCYQNCCYLRELWIRRQAITGATQIQRDAYDLSVPADSLVDFSGKMTDELASGMAVSSDRPFKSFVHGALEMIDSARKKSDGVIGVPIFTHKLNRFFGGWQNVVYMIAGRPGMGKTIVAVLSAIKAAEAGYPVAYVSLEVKGEFLVVRMLAEMLLIPYEEILKGRISDEQFAQLHQIAGRIENQPIDIYDEESRDISDVRNWLKDKQRRSGTKIVLIDYVQLLEDRTLGRRGEYEEQTAISKQLLKLQIKMNVPFLEFAQLSRKVEERATKRPNQADLKSTGQYEQDASVIMLLYRDDYYKNQRQNETGEPEAFDNELEIIVDKNRNGRTGSHYLYIDVATNRILDEKPFEEKFKAPNSFQAVSF